MEFRGGAGFDVHGGAYTSSSTSPQSDEDVELRRGPWTKEEDLVLRNYIACHGEGRWSSLALSAGLKRTGKSCRLRWLNYLKPGVRRGDITPEEQLLILDLHSQLGNRWSKIAQRLPGRTDNEIKNYWRTRVQKHAKQLQCDVNSKRFKDVMRYLWMPRLLERIQAAANPGGDHTAVYQNYPAQLGGDQTTASGSELGQVDPSTESSSGPVSSLEYSSAVTQLSSPATVTTSGQSSQFNGECWSSWTEAPLPSPCGYPNLGLPDFDWWPSGVFSESLWSMEDNWVIQQQQP